MLKDETKLLRPGDILISTANSLHLLGRTTHVRRVGRPMSFGAFMSLIRPGGRILDSYLIHCLRTPFASEFFFRNANTTTNISNLNLSTLAGFQVPLPPLEVQKEIVAEIEGYQRVVDGARAVLDSYRPHIPIHPDWPVAVLGELCKPEYGFTESAAESGDARFIRITDIAEDGTLRKEEPKFITLTDAARAFLLAKGDILVARTGATYGKTMLFEEDYPAVFASYLIRLRFPRERVHPRYYWAFSQSDEYWNQAKTLMSGGGQPQFNGNALKQIRLPLPSLATQEAIVAEVEAEQALVAANRELVARFEKKIRATFARVWGENEPASAKA